jgi:adenosylmethionine---8-amino-7-oxononanoate aminotransferase
MVAMTHAPLLAALDHAHVWHPFTPMRQWRESEPVIIERGEGEFLIDTRGHRYIDGVSSLWCNVHGHRVPPIDAAVQQQLGRIAHSTMLGLGNVPAIELAARLCSIAPGRLNKVFYSDAGATATEVAFKMAVGYWYHSGQPERNVFIALEGAYHGDTFGAMSVGYSDVFHRPYRKLTFRTEFVPVHDVAVLDARLGEVGSSVAAVVVEPIVQGAAGIIVQKPGYLRCVSELARRHGTLLIADEVATAFGRTGRMFACEHEGVEPDILCLGKGLSGGYLPLAATLCTDEIEQAFTGELHEMKTLYHGHTFTGNPLACAAALASLDLLEKENVIAEVNRKAESLTRWLSPLADCPHVREVRQRGLMCGIELVAGPHGDPAAAKGGAELSDFGESTHSYLRRSGLEVCHHARGKGVIIRPLGNVIVLMPPLSIRDENLKRLAEVVIDSIQVVCGR